jgi:hypothetical protein
MIDRPSQDLARAIFALGRINPFTAERRAWEQRALGPRFVPGDDEGATAANVAAIAEVAEDLVERMRARLRRSASTGTVTPEERELYGGAAFMALYYRHGAAIPAPTPADGEAPMPVASGYGAYVEDFQRLFADIGPPDPTIDTPPHLYACFWQIRRASDVIASTISGGSAPAAGLRAAAWQSVFSHDAARYRRYLFRAMPDIPTLITGSTGTGKELVARAIGLSGYVPFDDGRRRFAHQPVFIALNLQAMPATLVESELFGHRKGAFTGAVADRDGWLARCPRGGAVFLDEIGDLDPMLQVKLLRVLEDRAFHAVGDARLQRFAGKILAATNRDLPAAIAEGAFRSDLYWRLCGDRIETPTLRARLDADPLELRRILRALIARWVEGPQVDMVTDEVEAEIAASRGPRWPWPGNVRELAQCARNVLVRGTCGPAEPLGEAGPPADPAPDPDGLSAMAERGLPLAEVQRRYVERVYLRCGSYRAAAAALGIDWRTVRAQIEPG